MKQYKEPIQIECRQKEYRFQMGDLFYFQYHRHGSVGENTEVVVETDDIIRIIRKEAEYLHPERVRPGMSGGDEERVKVFFKAVAQGTTKIIVRRIYRFKIESECSATITVV